MFLRLLSLYLAWYLSFFTIMFIDTLLYSRKSVFRDIVFLVLSIYFERSFSLVKSLITSWRFT